MDTKLIMTAEKVLEYHKMGIFFKECPECKRVSAIEDNKFIKVKDIPLSQLQLLYRYPKTTSFYCHECEIKKRKELDDFIMEWDDILHITGDAMWFTAEGEKITSW